MMTCYDDAMRTIVELLTVNKRKNTAGLAGLMVTPTGFEVSG